MTSTPELLPKLATQKPPVEVMPDVSLDIVQLIKEADISQ